MDIEQKEKEEEEKKIEESKEEKKEDVKEDAKEENKEDKKEDGKGETKPIKKDAEENKEKVCREGHVLHSCFGRSEIDDPAYAHGNASCDVCRSPIDLDNVNQSKGFLRCAQCQYDLCTNCSMQKEGVCTYITHGKQHMA